MAVADVRLYVIDTVGRCATINVDPDTAERGPDCLTAVEEVFGHTVVGIFARMTQGGSIGLGDKLSVLP